MKTTLNKDLKYEDDLKYKDYLKYETNLKYEQDLEYEDCHNQNDDLKYVDGFK